MCNFFSLTSDGEGNILYADHKLRQRMLHGDLKEKRYRPDSHTSLNDYFGFRGEAEDSRNKYEYNPLTGKFTIDQINGKDDSEAVEVKVRALDFKTIMPELIIKPIVSPFKDRNFTGEITPEIVEKLRQWASVQTSMVNSVGDSVWDSVWTSAWRSVRRSVWDSAWDSAQAYAGSFFSIDNDQFEFDGYPFQCLVDLWEMGIVPSFDGETWKLHAREDAAVVYKITKEKLMNV